MDFPQRKSIRLPDFDYTSGVFFITLVTFNRISLFGQIVEHEMVLNEYGRIVLEEMERTPIIRPEMRIHIHQIMPNHHHINLSIHPVGAHGRAPGSAANHCQTPAHGKIFPLDQPIMNGHSSPKAYSLKAAEPGARPCAPTRSPRSLSSFVAGFKAITTSRINQLRGTPGQPVWQRNYFEHVIHDEDDWERIYAYIQTNPQNWEIDNEFYKTR